MDTTPIVRTFDALLTAGATVSAIVAAFFVMIAGFQYMGAGGSIRAIESAKGSLYNALIVCAFFVMLAGYQYMTAGGSVRAIESAKGSLYNAFIGLAIVVLCRVLANLVGGALGAPSA